MVAITVVLAAVLATFALGFIEDVSNPGPSVGQSTGALERTDGSKGAIVRVEHVAGETVDASELEIAIDATNACGERERIINLPDNAPAGSLEDGNVASGDIDESIVSGQSEWLAEFELGVLTTRDGDTTFDAGSSFEFRLTKEKCPVNKGDEVVVHVVHHPTNSILLTEELKA